MIDQIFSYREMCDTKKVQTLQRGMNFHLNPNYSVVLMSRRTNAPYKDKILGNGITIEYEGHDEPKTTSDINPKTLDQPKTTRNGNLTENGKFIEAIEKSKTTKSFPELVKVYEKIFPGVWSLKGLFDLVNYRIHNDGRRNVFIFTLTLPQRQKLITNEELNFIHTRLIPSDVKKEVWQRDKGTCVNCGSTKNLHFDHDLPFSKGGTSLTVKNVKLLCIKCNLAKSNKIE